MWHAVQEEEEDDEEGGRVEWWEEKKENIKTRGVWHMLPWGLHHWVWNKPSLCALSRPFPKLRIGYSRVSMPQGETMTSNQTQTWIILKAERAHREHFYHCFEAERWAAQCTQSEGGGQKRRKHWSPWGNSKPSWQGQRGIRSPKTWNHQSYNSHHPVCHSKSKHTKTNKQTNMETYNRLPAVVNVL